jgi:hypothetical protein
MTVAFGTWPKQRLNRVMDALDFEYLDYERFDKGAEGLKRKRIVSILNRQAARIVEDEKISKKAKSAPEPKVIVSKKRKPEKKPEVAEPKVTEAREETPSTPPVAEIAKILKVMTESLPIKLLSLLGPELTKLLQKKDQPSAIKEKAEGQKNKELLMLCKLLSGHHRWPRRPK